MRKYRIKERYYCDFLFIFDVEVRTFFGWVLVKRFQHDRDEEYAWLCAQELLDKLNEEI